MKKPFFERSEPWTSSELFDYAAACTDDERRQMIKRFGVDAAHRSEALALFPDYLKHEKRKEEKKQGLIKYHLRHFRAGFVALFDRMETKMDKPKRFIELCLAIIGFVELLQKLINFLIRLFSLFLSA